MENKMSNVVNGKTNIPFHRMLAYASMDAAGNLLYTTVTTFILYYYTDVFGLSFAAAGAILLAARILDAFDAPVWGFIIDHTHTRWGQSRPFWLWMSAPFAIFFILMFWSPAMSATGKFWWGLVTYLLFGICYTGIGTPITSILPNLSNDEDQRLKLNSTRSIGGMVGYFITATFTLSFVEFFSTGTAQSGWRNTAIILGIAVFLLLIFAFSDTREINKPKKAISIISSIKAAKSNWPWFLLVIVFIFYWLGNASRTSVVVYYTQYNLGHKGFASVLNALVMFQIIGMVAIPYLVKKFSKTHVLMAGMFLAALGQIMIYFTGNSLVMLAVAWSIASVGTGISVTLPFAMLANTVDYGEWKNGIRASGFLTAIGSSFAIKMGSGLGGWAPSVILAHAGYHAGVAQTASVKMLLTRCES